jgi:hypothetical protein
MAQIIKPAHSGEGRNPARRVSAAKASQILDLPRSAKGVSWRADARHWVPAFAGMSGDMLLL